MKYDGNWTVGCLGSPPSLCPQPHRSPLLPTQTVDDFQIMPPRPRWFRFTCRSSTAAASAAGYWFLISCTSSYQYSPQLTLACREMRSGWRASLTHKVDLFTMLEPFFMRDKKRERGSEWGREKKRDKDWTSPPLGLFSLLTHIQNWPPPPERPRICIIIVISLNGAAR